MDFSWILDSLARIYPEIILTGSILVVILLDLLNVKKQLILFTSIIIILVALGFVFRDIINYTESASIFKGSAAYDKFALFFKALFLVISLATALFSYPVITRWVSGYAEYYALLLSCTLGMILMSSANDLLMMYLALEFVSVTSYVLSGLLRKNRKSQEASLKYIIYGAAASGIMIYGMTYLYGLTGTLNVVEIGRSAVLAGIYPVSALIISVLTIAGFGYKMAAVPFHMWCPDVYEGAPTPVTAFFSVGPKIAGFAMFVRFLHGLFPENGQEPVFEYKIVIALISVLTMSIGNFTALHQNNLKRLLAYSGISHAGYMLLIFVVFKTDNITSLLFYASVYFIMNIGAFLVAILLEETYKVETIEQCRGLGWIAPGVCSLMAVFLFSLVGIPPLAGFIGKVFIISYIIREGPLGITLAVLAVAFSVISLGYYAKIIAKMFLEKPSEDLHPRPTPILLAFILWIMGIATIVLGIFPGWLYRISERAAQDILSKI